MKKKIIVSGIYTDYTKDECNDYVVLEPYLSEILKFRNDQTVQYVDYSRKSKDDLKSCQDFVEYKYRCYYPILSSWINTYHDTDYSVDFWKKTFCLSLKRYITSLYDSYLYYEKYFSLENSSCSILNLDSFKLPKTFVDSYEYIKNTHIGQEQIFSIYIREFYGDVFEEFSYSHKEQISNTENVNTQKLTIKKSIRQFLANIKNILVKKIKKGSPVVGIIGTAFPIITIFKLFIRSRGKIFLLDDLPDIPASPERKNKLDFDKVILSDRFDRFFFSSLACQMPSLYVENFKTTLENFNSLYLKQNKLKYIVSEAWISSDYLSLFIALGQSFKIKHINNEHNFLSHQFMGTNNKLIAELSDIFISLGWESPVYKNVISGASLFPFTTSKNYKVENQVLYIEGFPFVKKEDYSSGYGTSAEDAIKYLDFKHSFFKMIKPDTMKSIAYREYPSRGGSWLKFDESNWLKTNENKFNFIDKGVNTSIITMKKSRLVIFDYISTGYIESLLMNIPTIVFFDREQYYLDSDFEDFFEELIKVGIFQTNVENASSFVDDIVGNPSVWWEQESVQEARLNFLSKNIRKPDVMINILLNLSKNNAIKLLRE